METVSSIVDYKTGKPKTQDDADESLQLSIYALAARSMGFIAESLVIVNLADCSAVESRRSEKQLDSEAARVSSAAANIAEGNFESQAWPALPLLLLSQPLSGYGSELSFSPPNARPQ